MDDEDLKNLIPEIRCFALVGEFLQLWATMENALHDAIGTALEVEQTRLQILRENIEFSAKIYILRTLIDIAKAFPQRNKKSLQKELKALAEYSKLRNMIAHHQFEPHTDSKGVRFFVVKARGTFEIPQEIWAPSRFKEEHETIHKYQACLEGIKRAFEKKPIPAADLPRALQPHLGMDQFMHWFSPMRRITSPELASLLSRQAQVPPHSEQPSPGTNRQMPQSPEEKE